MRRYADALVVFGAIATAGAGLVWAGLPVDCFPDAIEWQAAEPNASARFGATRLPGIVMGPPEQSSPQLGATAVASLGHAGRATFVFDDVVIENGPGPDFIVFENAFFVGQPPASESDDYFVFAEPGRVEVSADGQSWVAFPFDASALAQVVGAGSVSKAQRESLAGLAGITPTFDGNWTVPDELLAWDSSGTGGVSGAGGDAFDLSDVGLSEARFVRIVDADTRNGAPGAGDGFDLDAVVVLKGRPTTSTSLDSDGDGLSDANESAIYGTDPFEADSDFDGTDDGREVATCRNPQSASTDPWFVPVPRVWIVPHAGAFDLRWQTLGSSEAYDVIEGDVADLSTLAGDTDLGATSCMANGVTVNTTAVAGQPPAGDGTFYVVRSTTQSTYGWSSSSGSRTTGSDCP